MSIVLGQKFYSGSLYLCLISCVLFSKFITCDQQEREYFPSAVVSKLSGGRLGGNLVAISHAFWLAHAYGVDARYVPFDFSEDLMLSRVCEPYSDDICSAYTSVVPASLTMDVVSEMGRRGESTLIMIPYFPDFLIEYVRTGGFDGISKPLFVADWRDQEYLEKMRLVCRPCKSIRTPKLPMGRMCVALHLRFGGGFDLPCADGVEGDFLANDKLFPLKCPPLCFYIEQILRLYEMLDRAPLYVFVFTDEPDPSVLVERILPHIGDRDIIFDYRKEGNAHDKNVLEDFVFMQKFPYMIRPQSNYSYMAARLGSTSLEIEPFFYIWSGIRLSITHVHVAYKDGREMVLQSSADLYR